MGEKVKTKERQVSVIVREGLCASVCLCGIILLFLLAYNKYCALGHTYNRVKELIF